MYWSPLKKVGLAVGPHDGSIDAMLKKLTASQS
jgi:hypothetical protein